MDNIEVKYITPYLPYKLKLGSPKMKNGSRAIMTLRGGHITESGLSEGLYKPILRPLSDLTKEIEVNGKKFVPIVELLKIIHPKDYNNEIVHSTVGFPSAWYKNNALLSQTIWTNDLDKTPYWIIEKLLEWHFDVFGLIDKGLAIDMNTY